MLNFLQASLAHQLLPKEQHTKPEEVVLDIFAQKHLTTNSWLQDVPYLLPIIAEIEAEMKERSDLDSLVVNKK